MLFSIVLASFVAVATAQTAAQNASAAGIAAKVPACALPCDQAAITQVGCGLTDYSCHCAHGSQLAVIIPPCLKNSTCTTADLTTFGAIPEAICAALNITAATNTTTSSNSTASSSGSATAVPSGPSSTSGSSSSTTAPSSNGAGINGVASGLFAVVGAGFLAILL